MIVRIAMPSVVIVQGKPRPVKKDIILRMGYVLRKANAPMDQNQRLRPIGRGNVAAHYIRYGIIVPGMKYRPPVSLNRIVPMMKKVARAVMAMRQMVKDIFVV